MDLGLWWVIMIGIDQEDKMIEKINELGDKLAELENKLNVALADFETETGIRANVKVDDVSGLHPFVTLTSQDKTPVPAEWPRERTFPWEPPR